MIRRYKLGRDVELHKRTLERGLLSLIGPDARAASPARADARRAPSTPTRAAELGGRAGACWSRTDVGVDVICDAGRRPRACATRCSRRGAVPVGEDAAEIVRVERGRPRYGSTSTTRVIPQEAGLNERAVSLHQGLLRRPGDGRAAALPRQAEPPPARAAALRAGRAGRPRCALGERDGRAARQRRRLPDASARSRWRSCAARRSRATRSPSARTVLRPTSSSFRSPKRQATKGRKRAQRRSGAQNPHPVRETRLRTRGARFDRATRSFLPSSLPSSPVVRRRSRGLPSHHDPEPVHDREVVEAQPAIQSLRPVIRVGR